MKKSRFTEEQIIGVLKEADIGMKVANLFRKGRISDVTFYNSRSQFSGMGISEARGMKSLGEENQKLTRPVLEQALDILVLKDVLQKSSIARVAQRSLATHQTIRLLRGMGLYLNTPESAHLSTSDSCSGRWSRLSKDASGNPPGIKGVQK